MRPKATDRKAGLHARHLGDCSATAKLDRHIRSIGLIIATALGIATLATWWPLAWMNLDGDRMVSASKIYLNGGDPYSLPGYLYSPFAPILTAPLAIAPFGLGVLFLIKVELVAGYTWRLFGPLAAVAVLLSPPISSDLLLGNVNLVLIAAAVWAVSSDRFVSGAALGILLAAFPKPMFLPILLWMAMYRRHATIGVLAGLAVSSAIGAALAGPSAYLGYAELLLRGGGVTSHFVGNAGLTFNDPTAGFVVGLAALAAFLWSLSTRDPPTSLMIAAAAGMLVGTYQPLYSTELVFGALPLYASSHPERARLAAAAAFGAIANLTGAAIVVLASVIPILPMNLRKYLLTRTCHGTSAAVRLSTPGPPDVED